MKIKKYALLSILLCAIIGIMLIPRALLWYINKQYNVLAQNVVLHFNYIELQNVEIINNNLIAGFETVTVDLSKNIIATNGLATYTVTNNKNVATINERQYKTLTVKNTSIQVVQPNKPVPFFIENADIVYVPRQNILQINSQFINTSLFDSIDIDLTNVHCTFLNRKIQSCKIDAAVGKYNDIYIQSEDIDVTNTKFSTRAVNFNQKQNYAIIDNIEFNYSVDSINDIFASKIQLSHDFLYQVPLETFDFILPQISLNNLREQEISASLNNVQFVFDLVRQRLKLQNNCQTLIDSLPDALKHPVFMSTKWQGEFRLEVRRFPDVKINIYNACRPTTIPAQINKLSSNFEYTIYSPDNIPAKNIVGPSQLGWTLFEDISTNIINAVTATEDPAFFKHGGIIPAAFEVCLKEHLKGGRRCGGSTVTMQLAKNLWLDRKQSLGRKLQEIILATLLESTLTKQKILEVYLNIIEYGPNVYGITAASETFFNTSPIMLDQRQAIYLLLRLPSPNRAATFEQMSSMIDVIRKNIDKKEYDQTQLVPALKSTLIDTRTSVPK